MDLHDLTAGYALDALDPDERARYEEHLASCESCRDGAAGVLAGRRRARPGGRRAAAARIAPGPDPRAGARTSGRTSSRCAVASRCRSSRRPRRLRPWSAIALGIWSVGLSSDLDDANSVLAVLSDPNARVHPTSRRRGQASSSRPTGRAALVVRMLAPAPAGKDYEIWVFENGVPKSAGLFERPGVAMLSRKVEPGQTVAVTLEPDGGVDAPTERPALHGRLGVANPSRSRGGCVPTRSVESARVSELTARTDAPVRIRRLPPRPGAGRPRRGRRPRHARADADRLGQVAHLPARGDAAADADARPLPLIALMKDQVDKLPPEVAAQATLINSSLDPDEAAARLRGGRGPLPAPLRRPGAAPAAALPRRDRRHRHRPRRDRRGALRQHVGPRLPARLSLHPPRSRRPRHGPRSSA